MKEYQFKTNINCGGCVAKVTPVLDSVAGVGNWEVDIKNPQKTLTISGTNVSEAAIIKAVNSAGFKAEVLN